MQCVSQSAAGTTSVASATAIAGAVKSVTPGTTTSTCDSPMTDLSPAAQAVDRAVADRIQLLGEIAPSRQIAAAALRAAADQVVPHSEVMPQQDLESRREAMVWGMVNQTQVTRQQLLAIAAELEGAGGH